jgi:hypothetical protein
MAKICHAPDARKIAYAQTSHSDWHFVVGFCRTNWGIAHTATAAHIGVVALDFASSANYFVICGQWVGGMGIQ